VCVVVGVRISVWATKPVRFTHRLSAFTKPSCLNLARCKQSSSCQLVSRDTRGIQFVWNVSVTPANVSCMRSGIDDRLHKKILS